MQLKFCNSISLGEGAYCIMLHVSDGISPDEHVSFVVTGDVFVVLR